MTIYERGRFGPSGWTPMRGRVFWAAVGGAAKDHVGDAGGTFLSRPLDLHLDASWPSSEFDRAALASRLLPEAEEFDECPDWWGCERPAENPQTQGHPRYGRA